jgi:microcystin-dependent protein
MDEYVSSPVSLDRFLFPVGTILNWTTTTVPKGWLLCDGTGYAIATYPELYAAISTNFGSSGGLFYVPNFSSRTPYGTSTSPFGYTGAATVTLTGGQTGIKGHSHNTFDFSTTGFNNANTGSSASAAYNTVDAGGSTSTVSAATAASAHDNLQPYRSLSFIIKAFG